MTVVVTGASGHVGGNLLRALLASGRPVRAMVHRDRRAVEGLDLEVVTGDVRDLETLRRAFAGAEVVYHTAAYISILGGEWPLLEQINVLGTRNVVQACLECRVRRLIHFSSIHALEQEPLDLPVDESRPLVDSRRASPYSRSKAAGEREVRAGMARGLDAVILYPTAIVGPYDFRPSHFGQVLLYLAQGKLPALVAGGFDWVDVRDVVAAALRAEKVAPPGGRYLLSGHWVALPEIAALVEEFTGVPAPRLVVPLGLARLVAPPATLAARLLRMRPLFTRTAIEALDSNRQVSHERAGRDLAYRPRPFRETIRDTLRWFAEAGRLPLFPPLQEER
ncbi:MAG: NAD-dependent epimerase/dehydratase family protein [Chloroflexia bacterium]